MSQGAERTWSPGSLHGSLKSHDKKLLKDHLRNVSSIAEQLAAAHDTNIDKELLKYVGWTHDLGKVHPQFQAYLRGAREGVEHSRPSSYFTLSLTQDIMAAEAVRRHHGGLQDIEQVKDFWAGDQLSFDSVNRDMKVLMPDWPYLFSEGDWYDLVDYVNLDLDVDEDDWLQLRTLYSLFIAADRMDAIGVSQVDFRELPGFHLPSFASDTDMSKWRTSVREICLGNLPDCISPGIYTLTMPTGSGKTVTGLQIARQFAAKINATSIVYALPFIAIVEQNADIARKVFGENVQEDHSGVFSSGDEVSESTQDSWHRMSGVFRYWTEPVIVTTLAAFWSALFNPRANSAMNFHRMHRAVVVLDEPQSIRPELWSGFGKTMQFLAEQWGTVFLLMTATQPIIGQGKELAQNVQPFPVSRHTYQYVEERITVDDLPHLLEDRLPIHEGCGLIVLNTKKSAYEAWLKLQRRLYGPVLFLSRSMAPIHRRQTMECLKCMRKKGRRHHLVATQVVEAGVDLDFDWVYRDMGPLDSVIQVAGRCNRHFNSTDPGRVLIAELVDSNDRPFHSFVYSKILTHCAREVLARHRAFSEHEVPAMVDTYYRHIIVGLRAEDCFQQICSGQWGSLPELIETKYSEEVPVFVELDPELIPLLDELEQTEWTFENQDRIRYLRRKAAQYMIEIPLKSLFKSMGAIGRIVTTSDHPPLRNVLSERCWLISRDAIGTLYDPLAGYIHPGLLDDDIANNMF